MPPLPSQPETQDSETNNPGSLKPKFGFVQPGIRVSETRLEPEIRIAETRNRD